MNSFNGNTGTISISGQNFINCPVYMGYPMYALPQPAPGGFYPGGFGPGGFGPGAAPGGFGPGAAPGGFGPGGFGPGGFWPGGAGAVAAPFPGGAQDQPVAAAPAVVEPGPVHPALEAPAPIGYEVVEISDDEPVSPVNLRRLADEARRNADRAELALTQALEVSAADAAARRLHEQRMGAAVGEAVNQQRLAKEHADSSLASSKDAGRAQDKCWQHMLSCFRHKREAQDAEQQALQNAQAAAGSAAAAHASATTASNSAAAARQQANVARQARRRARRHADDADIHADAAQQSVVAVEAGVRAAGDIMAQASSVRQDARQFADRAEAAAQRVNPPFILVMDYDGPAAAPAAPVAAPAPAAPVAVPPAAQPGDAPLIGRHSLRSSSGRNVRARYSS